jgi:hypothetical protein
MYIQKFIMTDNINRGSYFFAHVEKSLKK